MALAVVALVVAATGGLAITAAEASAVPPEWTTAPSLSAARSHHTETKLPSGEVLVVGGRDGTTYRGSVDLYSSTGSSRTATGALNTPRSHHTATLLTGPGCGSRCGKVLVVGGRDGNGVIASAELYDPTAGTWSAAGSLVQARADHTATLLTGGPCVGIAPGIAPPAYCGKVLVAGGRDGVGSLASAELYDPATGNWSSFADPTTCTPAPTEPSVGCPGPLGGSRADHTATALSEPVVSGAAELTKGMVLVAGGRTGTSVGTSGGAVLASAELYNPALGIWVPAGPMTDLRTDHTATQLSDGRVLMAGGSIGQAGVDDPFTQGAEIITNSADLYDPMTNAHSPTNLLTTARAGHTATRLVGTSCVGTNRSSPCDNVLAAGRIAGNSGGEDTSEIYNYDSDAPRLADIDDGWRPTADLLAARGGYHTATLLNNGKVLVTGGLDGFGPAALSSAELYTAAP
ncbi:MAG: kelch repeat-containing protein [Solirubrobacteraceae bacterium]